jgi:hypothetical protein
VILMMGSILITRKGSLCLTLTAKIAKMSGGRPLVVRLQPLPWITSTISLPTNSRSTGQAPLHQSTHLDQMESHLGENADILATINLQDQRQ